MKALAFIIAMICCFACFMAGYDMGEKKGEPLYFKVVEEVHDTVPSIPDTVIGEVLIGTKIVKVPILDTVPLIDTIEATLPIVQREYEDSTYHAWVSGYEPVLDSIKVYRQTRIITNTIYNKEKRWGVFGGVGVGVTSKGLAPCVAIGIGYRL